MISFVLIISITYLFIYFQFRFFQKEKRKTQSYKFYALRDELVGMAVFEGANLKKDPYRGMYHITNVLVNEVENLNFNTISSIVSIAVKDILENGIKNETERPAISYKIGEAVVKTCIENSILLKIAIRFRWTTPAIFAMPILRELKNYIKKSKIYKTTRDINLIQDTLRLA